MPVRRGYEFGKDQSVSYTRWLILECGGLTRHRSYGNHRCSNRLTERDEAVYWSAVSSHRK